MSTWTSRLIPFFAAIVMLLVLVLPVLARNDSTPVTICHKPGTPAEQTLVVDDDAVPGHLGHGDYLGPCTDTPTGTPTAPVPSSVPTPTDTSTPVPSDVPSDTPTITPTPPEPSGSIDVPATGTNGCSVGCHATGTPPHEHITNPPTDTVGITEAQQPSDMLIGLLTLLITTPLLMFILTARNKESN
jgi:hypothetical protein